MHDNIDLELCEHCPSTEHGNDMEFVNECPGHMCDIAKTYLDQAITMERVIS